ncbi:MULTISPECIES: cytochrome ubiquinol oxidase subunit I [Empedobacter]|uniref:Cytochrome d ubiquinol oxidase subunit 1 n=1 Tax=Empedobacter falsenii TaxID=343874 RepID=A0A376G6S0_9FLAO|nr:MULTISPECIES: cytochrome ubiquinol oxidase subunit I [Empedobacter]HBX61717.1 cytochrome ubiquinol oxidase subunit I [Flavobacteriaceae bacterium]MBW1618081.1 cytochrome ubiquinol oxidase subunit I [Empedobacter falsenii]MBY0067431.1 cytochrome ubiquinol oxidase subunit I [Empedobacter falsenii]MDH0660226.1 cytochrome ubiquinol oxidase subunit I [Empedobacter sp. GD03865]MDH1603710.1 cytochrome ubiquinol oxidase subunit I [Empedobacter sp. GD03739]
MDDFIAARSQMAMSLAFHIVFSCVGMVMPFMMAIAHYKYLKTKNEIYKGLTKAWSKGVAILFATGAVSGTMLSFELGLLFPKFMEHAGPIFGMPFSLEGTAFFIEAIALGFFLYGWDKFNKWFHWICGVIVGISGLASGILVVAANAWMNSPSGFDFINGEYLNIDPVKAMFNDAWFSQALHMTIAAFCATGFAVAGLHAYLILKGKNVNFHREAFKISSVLAITAAMLAPLSGDISAKDVAKRQPIKLAAMEAHFKTEESASFVLGGIVDESKEEIKYAIKVPGVLSFLVHSDFKTPVKGLEEFPKDEWPPVAVVHYAFQIMITFGMLMMGIAVIYLIAQFFKKDWRTKRWFYKLFMIATPFGYIALEAGWTVTEVGRQPWIIYGIMRTVDSITPMPGIQYSFYIFTFVFITLSIILVFLMNRQIQMVAKLYDPEDPNYKPEKH